MKTSITPNPHAASVLRAALPEILFTPDLALALGGISESAARRIVLRGDCGPHVRIGRRLAVRRESLLDAFAERETGAGGRRGLAVVGDVPPPCGQPAPAEGPS